MKLLPAPGNFGAILYTTYHSGITRIPLRGGGGGRFKIFLEKWGYLHGVKQSHAFARGFGVMLPQEILKNDAIWCVLEYILLKFCKTKCENIYFFI